MTRRQRTKRRAQKWALKRWARCPLRVQAERERREQRRKEIAAAFNDYEIVAMEWAKWRGRMGVEAPHGVILSSALDPADRLVSTDYDSCYIDEPPHTVEPIPARADLPHTEDNRQGIDT